MARGGKVNSSICWDCKNCSPLTCEWVKRLEPVWEKAESREIVVANKLQPIHVVLECRNFEEREKGGGRR